MNEPAQPAPGQEQKPIAGSSLVVTAGSDPAKMLAALESLSGFPEISEIIAICDGLADTSAAIRKRFGDRVRILGYNHRLGRGDALMEGLRNISAPIAGFIDPDEAIPADDYIRLLRQLQSAEGTDAIIASRYLRPQDVRISLKRRLLSRVFNRYVNALFHFGFADTQCGLKLVKGHALAAVLPALGLTSWAFDLDLLLQLKTRGYAVREEPVSWDEHASARLKSWRASFQMFLATFRLWAVVKTPLGRFHLPRTIMSLLYAILEGGFEKNENTVLFLNFKDIHHPQAGGAEEYIFNIGKWMIRRGYRVIVYCPRFPGSKSHEIVDGVEIYRIGTQMLTYALFPIWYFLAFRQRCRVIVDAENGIPFFARLIAFRRKTVLLLHHYHGDVLLQELPFPLGRLAYILERWLMPLVYRKCAAVAVSPSTRNEFVKIGFDPRAIRVVYCGVTQPQTTHYDKFPDPTVCYFGRLKKYKNIDVLMEIFKRVQTRVPSARLLVAGRGATGPYREKAAALGIEPSVSFIENPDEEQKYSILGRSWIFASCSKKEGWSITVIEANSVGTPAVGFAVPGFVDSIQEGLNGKLARDEQDFSEILTGFLTRPPQSDPRIIEYAAQFTWERAGADMADIIDELVAVPGHAG